MREGRRGEWEGEGSGNYSPHISSQDQWLCQSTEPPPYHIDLQSQCTVLEGVK